MKRCSLVLLAASSLLWVSEVYAATRPHYGGTLRIALREASQTLDPTDAAANVPAGLLRHVFETLVALDVNDRPQPLLATAWEAEAGNQRWRFVLRAGVNFHDGAPLDANIVAAALRASNPEWKVSSVDNAVMIQTQFADPELPSELALARNSIVRHADGKLSGTGPFAIAQWIPGKHLTLSANDRYWAGRPFLDTIEVEFSKNDRDQMMLLDLAKADAVEVAPENIRRAQSDGRTLVTSHPEELMALVFATDSSSDDETRARKALAASIDVAAINNVVLQGSGESTSALLPNWVSGYAFVFPASSSTGHKPQDLLPAKQRPTWSLSYDASDPLAHVVAQRIQLNARDAGIGLQPITSGTADVRLVRIPLPSSSPQVALAELARAFQLGQPKDEGGSITELYSAENTLLKSHRIIPLFHLRRAFALRSNVHNWSATPDGDLQLSSVWLSTEKP
jgi:peptide/nickel transport system substrate-binding protein